MNKIKINDNLTVHSDLDVNHPIALHQWFDADINGDDANFSMMQLTAQIFHSDLKYFNLKKATLIDPDLRRPIYIFKFKDPDIYLRFMAKHAAHLIAFQQIQVEKIDGEDTPVSGHAFGRDLYRLRAFTAWLEHITGGVESNYVQDCSIKSIKGSMTVCVPDVSFDDFISCLKGEKTLMKKEEDIDLNEEVEIDGVKMTFEKMSDYFKKKAVLEGVEAILAN